MAWRKRRKAARKWGKRKGRKGGARRFFRKRLGKRGRSSTIVNRRPSIVPDRYITKLTYVERIKVAADGGLTAAWIYMRGNSCFDPNFAVGGHQPLGFDQLCGPAGSALYYSYRVIGSKIAVETYSNTNTVTQGEHVALLSTTDSTYGPASLEVAEEQPYVKSKRRLRVAVTGYPIKLRGYMSTTKVFGEKYSTIMSDENYAANYNANPTFEWFWAIGVRNMDITTVLDWYHNIKMTYYVIFYNRNELTQS